MCYILRSCIVVILVFSLKTIQAQSVIKEFNAGDYYSNNIHFSLINFENGDILKVGNLQSLNDFQLSRLSPDLSTVVWSKIYKIDNLQCDFDLPSGYKKFLRVLVHIDNEQQLWVRFPSYHFSTNKVIHHFLLLNSNGDLIWQRSFDSINGNHIYFSGRLIDTGSGVDFFYIDTNLSNDNFDSLSLVSVDYLGNAVRKSVYSHYDSNRDEWEYFNYVVKSPDEDILLQVNHFGGWSYSSLFNLYFPEKGKQISFNSDRILNGILATINGAVQWINNEEFIFYTTFADRLGLNYGLLNASLLIARVNINGEVVWSKATEFEKVFYNFNAVWNFTQKAILLEDDKIIIPVSGVDGSGSGFITLDIDTGNILNTNFWNNNGMNTYISGLLRQDKTVYLVSNPYKFPPTSNTDYTPFIMLDDLDNSASCIAISSCEFVLNDFDLKFDLEESPLIISQKDSVMESRCSLQIEILPIQLDWKEICPDVAHQPDAFFTLISDTICQKELTSVVVQYNHQAFKYTWKLNGLEVTPDTARNDTFYFNFDLEGEAELHLTTSRLGCISEYSDSIFIKLGAEVHVPSDTTKCIGESILIDLPGEDGFVIQWENGSNLLEVDTPGVYVFTSFNTTTGCMFTSSVNVSDKEAPTVQIDSFYSFCSNDLGRRILPKVIGLDTKMEWIYPVQPGRFLLYPATSDTYLLKVEREGCMDTISVKVEVLPCTDTETETCNVFIPDAFSPNDDGINDYLEIFLGCKSGILSFRLEIFDRWGNMVFQSDEFNRQWDGNIEGKIAPAGGYTYKLKMTLESENEFEEVFREGFVGLVR